MESEDFFPKHCMRAVVVIIQCLFFKSYASNPLFLRICNSFSLLHGIYSTKNGYITGIRKNLPYLYTGLLVMSTPFPTGFRVLAHLAGHVIHRVGQGSADGPCFRSTAPPAVRQG